MSLRAFTEQSREEVVKSMVNWSVSKQMWSFPKKKRFLAKKPECPQTAYQQNLSTITHKCITFATSTRNLFNDTRDNPSPAVYQHLAPTPKQVPLFAESREACIFNSYIPLELARHPGPDKYQNSETKDSKKGFTMRPKTANHRNYFIDDHERKQVPSPCHYDFNMEKKGDCMVSKFRSVTLGGAGLMRKQERFLDLSMKTPSPFVYEPKKVSLKSKSIGGRIGTSLRRSFIDDVKTSKRGPGPGNYQLPSEFGHYKACSSKRTVTLQ